MKVSGDLKKMIESALVDGKLNENEKVVLLRKAEKEGLDKDEFEIYINSLIYSYKVNNNSDSVNKLRGLIAWFFQKKRRFILLIIGILFLITVISERINSNDENELSNNLGCINISDCLTKYKFEEARTYHSKLGEFDLNKQSGIKNIITAEISYYLSNDSKDIALSSILEYSFHYSPIYQGERNENNSYNEESNWYNAQLEKLITVFEHDTDKLKMLVNLIKPILKVKKLISEYIDSDGKKCCAHLDQVEFYEDNNFKKQLEKKYKLK
jgi:hypothetical protein